MCILVKNGDRIPIGLIEHQRGVFQDGLSRQWNGVDRRIVLPVSQHNIESRGSVCLIGQQIIPGEVANAVDGVAGGNAVVIDKNDEADFRVLVSKEGGRVEDRFPCDFVVDKLIINPFCQHRLRDAINFNAFQHELSLVHVAAVDTDSFVNQPQSELLQNLTLINPDFIEIGVRINRRLIFGIRQLSLRL